MYYVLVIVLIGYVYWWSIFF